MDGPSPKEIDAALVDVDRLIANINGDLRRMPDGKRNTRWHTDRVKERRRLMEQRDGLLRQQAEMALRN